MKLLSAKANRQTLQIKKYGTAAGLSTKKLEQYLKNEI